MGIDISVEVYEKGRGPKTKFSLENDINGEISLQQFAEHVRQMSIIVAAEVLREEQRKGFDKNPVVVTDGRVGKSFLDVKPFGKIQFTSRKVTSLEIVEVIYKGILERSKVVTGTYIEGNLVFLNGKVIAVNMTELKQWLASSPKTNVGDEFRFVNVIPYARKLERRGVTAQRSQSRSVKNRSGRGKSGGSSLAANGVYYLTTRSAVRQYKGNAQIFFGFILGSTLGVQGIPAQTKAGKPLRRNFAPPKGKKATKRNSGPYLYPYIKLIIGEGVS